MNNSRMIWVVGILALLAAVAASLAVGSVSLSAAQLWQGVQGHNKEALETVIVQELRLPRALLALLVGASLGMAGAALQAFLRNPLAEPALLGVTNGAALGAVVVFYAGLSLNDAAMLPLGAMAGALLAVGLTYKLAGRTGGAAALVLAGIAVSSLFGAGVAVVLNLVSNPFAAMEVVFWLMGSLTDRTMDQVGMIVLPTVAGWVLLLSCSRGLAALALGERTAASMGISVSALQWRLALGVALAVGAGVAVVGSIGFVGLVVPHVMRRWVGSAPTRLLPASALGGAFLLLLADIAVRLIPTSGMELRVGVVTALLGAPFFVMLLVQMRGRDVR